MSSALRTSRAFFLLIVALAAPAPFGAAQSMTAPAAPRTTKPTPQTSVVTTTERDPSGRKITTIVVDLQGAPKSMEPIAEPRSLRIDDRAQVRFRLRNLSPLDICTRNGISTTPLVDTPPIESLVTTLAGLGGVAGNSNAGLISQNFVASGAAVNRDASFLSDKIADSEKEEKKKPACKMLDDAEYLSFIRAYKQFLQEAPQLIGTPDSPQAPCPVTPPSPIPTLAPSSVPPSDPAAPSASASFSEKNDASDLRRKATQIELLCEIDRESRDLTSFTADDYRGARETRFVVASNSRFNAVRTTFTVPIPTVARASALQALIDQMKRYADDLHKKYDFQASAPSADAPAPLPSIPGVLMAAPTTLSFTKAGEPQKITLTSGGEAGSFTAEPLSDKGWLLLATTGDAVPHASALKDIAPDHGSFPLLVSVSAAALDGKTHYGTILIKGTGKAKGSTLITVVVKPADDAAAEESCDHRTLHRIDRHLEEANAMYSIVTDGNKSLQASQAALKSSYTALVKLEDDFLRRKNVLHSVQQAFENGEIILEQDIDLGTDRKTTSTGYLSCVSSANLSTATTTNINYSLSYQDVPNWTASAGFLVSFQPNQVIGIATMNTGTAAVPVNTQYFTATTRTPVQLFPMAYLNYRLGGYRQKQYGRTKEDQLVKTLNASFGFGVNPNTGTNQPEFFGGLAMGWNRFLLHPGVHVGHTESLGGGYTFASPVGSLTAAPIAWSYHYKFSIGFSVRVAPY